MFDTLLMKIRQRKIELCLNRSGRCLVKSKQPNDRPRKIELCLTRAGNCLFKIHWYWNGITCIYICIYIYKCVCVFMCLLFGLSGYWSNGSYRIGYAQDWAMPSSLWHISNEKAPPESQKVRQQKIELCLNRCDRCLVKRKQQKAWKSGNTKLSSASIGVADVWCDRLLVKRKQPKARQLKIELCLNRCGRCLFKRKQPKARNPGNSRVS